VNEPYFQEAEKTFCSLLENFLPRKEISAELYKTEISNLEKYGYGVKGFLLSMIETALRISNKKVPSEIIEKIINLGKSILEKPTELLADVDFVLNKLGSNYKLILATKGDLLDQHRKLTKSGLGHHFHRIEIMNDKNESEYRELLKRLEIRSEEFLMVGNSLKSDILPVVSIGGQAIHIPYHTTWQHETTDKKNISGLYCEISKLTELLEMLK